LVVDDDQGVTEVCERLLRLEGCEVRTALDAATGLREATTALPDAIILDWRMPITDGLGFLRQLRALDAHRHTPVAVVTGDYCIDDAVIAELQALGAGLRFKPLWLEDLVELVFAMFGGGVSPSASDSPTRRDERTERR
jgi:DNA-binding response OmpR family regulator